MDHKMLSLQHCMHVSKEKKIRTKTSKLRTDNLFVFAVL